jgi:dATP pyrophosphohydrolase
MTRAPFNVLVFPYRYTIKVELEYALLRRADAGYWSGIAGGGEDNETPLEAARRETHEETSIPMDSEFLQLDTIAPVPVTEFSVSHIWGEDVFVIPQYSFGISANNVEITLSDEHTECRWLDYRQACELLVYETNKIALWELDRKLRGLGPRDTS